MDYKIKITQLAQKDIADIVAYISVNLQNIPAAKRFTKELRSTFAKIAFMPSMFPQHFDEQFGLFSYRKSIVKNYIVFYDVDETTQTVHILRVLYGRRDLSSDQFLFF